MMSLVCDIDIWRVQLESVRVTYGDYLFERYWTLTTLKISLLFQPCRYAR